MIWFKYVFVNVYKIYKYLFKLQWSVKKHSWNKFLNNIKNTFFINNNFKFYNINFCINKIIYFFFNYNVNFRIKKGKMKYLNFIKNFIFLPSLYNISDISSIILDLKYKKNFYMQILYWYFKQVRPIRFNYNYNDLFKFFNSILQIMLSYIFYFNLLAKKLILFKRIKFKLFLKLKKFFRYIYLQCIKSFKYYKNIKYFLYSFYIKKKKKKYILKKFSNYFLKKNLNIFFILNNLLCKLFLFLVKNWLDINLSFLVPNNDGVYFNSNKILDITNKKIYFFLFLKYRMAWQRLYKATYVEYYKPIKFLINFKKIKNF